MTTLADELGLEKVITPPPIMSTGPFTWKDAGAYPWAMEAYETMRSMFWVETPLQLGPDVIDYNTKLTAGERQVFKTIMKFFTQGDIEVAKVYTKLYMPHFHRPDITMMMSVISFFETIHQKAYAYTIEGLGFRSTIFEEFADIPEMNGKYQLMLDAMVNEHKQGTRKWYLGMLKHIAIYSGFIEGLSLFAMFAILFSYKNTGTMLSTATIVEYSIKDESQHCEAMMHVYHTLKAELGVTPEEEKQLHKEILEFGDALVAQEEVYLRYVFSKGEARGITLEESLDYLDYIYEVRKYYLGMPAKDKRDHPLPWLEAVDGSSYIHANFFESRSSEYSIGSLTGSHSDCSFE